MNCPNPNCNMQELPANAKFCPVCGCKIEENITKSIEIHGYKEWYLTHLPVRIFVNNVLYAEVNHDEVKKIKIKRENCAMTFQLGRTRPFILNVPAEFEGKILIETNRWTGKLSAILTNI